MKRSGRAVLGVLRARGWRLVAVVVFIVAAAAFVLVPVELEKRRKAEVIGTIQMALAKQDAEAALLRALEVDKVYLVQWRGSEETHLSLYIGGLLIDVAGNARVGGTE